jgi:hypothetical protein
MHWWYTTRLSSHMSAPLHAPLSHASPTPSKSKSSCEALGVLRQFSNASPTPSQSESVLFHRFGPALLLHRPDALISWIPGIRRASGDSVGSGAGAVAGALRFQPPPVRT